MTVFVNAHYRSDHCLQPVSRSSGSWSERPGMTLSAGSYSLTVDPCSHFCIFLAPCRCAARVTHTSGRKTILVGHDQ